MEFYLIQNQSHLLHRIIQKTYLSIITALFCVGFDVVITDIKTNTFSWPWPPCEYIYIHIDMHVLHVSICICMCVNFIYLIIYVRDKHEALHCSMENSIVPKCCTVTRSLHPGSTTIYLAIEIRAHKLRLPALIVMKDCYQFFVLDTLCIYLPSANKYCVMVTCVLFCILNEHYVTSCQ